MQLFTDLNWDVKDLLVARVDQSGGDIKLGFETIYNFIAKGFYS